MTASAFATRPPVSACELDIQKALGRCAHIARSYGFDLWQDRNRRDWEQDLLTMHRHGGLRSIKLRLLDKDGGITLSFDLDFSAGSPTYVGVDSAKGLELPLLPPGSVGKHELLITHDESVTKAIKHLLRANWSPAEKRTDRTTERFASEHTGHASSGRQRAEMSVAGARRPLSVLRVMAGGQYAFAFCQQLKAEVFMHIKFAPAGFAFRPNQSVSAVVVQTPRGPQGRNITEG